MIVPLELRNDFNINSYNNDKNDNNDDDENNNVNSDSFNPHDDLYDLLNKTDLSKKRKSKYYTEIK